MFSLRTPHPCQPSLFSQPLLPWNHYSPFSRAAFLFCFGLCWSAHPAPPGAELDHRRQCHDPFDWRNQTFSPLAVGWLHLSAQSCLCSWRSGGPSPQRQELLQGRGCLEVVVSSWEMQSTLLLDYMLPGFLLCIYTYLQGGLCADQLPICSSPALPLYLWEALPMKALVEGWRIGSRKKPPSASCGIFSIVSEPTWQVSQVHLWSMTLILKAYQYRLLSLSL